MTAFRETSRSLPIALLRARDAVMSRFRPLLAERGFTEQQWRVLRVLEEGGPLDPTEIAERCVIMTPSMTRILKTLEDDGLVKRENHPGDGRRVLISLTPSGELAIAEASSGSNEIYADIEREYGRERLEKLLDLLEGLTEVRNR